MNKLTKSISSSHAMRDRGSIGFWRPVGSAVPEAGRDAVAVATSKGDFYGGDSLTTE